jgi:hypothetical protein
LDTTATTIPGLSSVVRGHTLELAFVENVQVFSRACSRWISSDSICGFLAEPLFLDGAILKMCYFISLLFILKHDLSFVGD